jgi:hypothetical protein
MCTPVVLTVMAALGTATPSPPPLRQPAPAASPSHAGATGETPGGKAASLAATAPTVCMIHPNVPAAE